MNFYKTLGLKNSRIDVADALRGLAVAGIILYHSVEHFNMYDGSIAHAYTLGCDDWMADVLALLLSGKMYGIFALLFGLSFFIMNDNQQQRGNCFSGRFAWRMFLLAMLGIVNTAFFDGDILFSYAIYGLVLIPLSYVLLWYGKEWFRKGLSFLRQFGKMSLTNYFLQSIIGCGLFAYYGFNLQTKLGITYAFFVGIAMVVVQCLFSNLWLKYHSHGPFEGIWKKLTWIKF